MLDVALQSGVFFRYDAGSGLREIEGRCSLYLAMKIYLLRHAHALTSYPDAERILSDEGRRNVTNLGSFLCRKESFQPKQVWTSPLVRAQETANILHQSLQPALNGPWTENCNDLLEPERDPFSLIELLSEVRQDVLLVGHNPNLEILFSLLVSGERHRARIYLKTCVLVCLEWLPWPDRQQSGSCVVRWVFDPRLL